MVSQFPSCCPRWSSLWCVLLILLAPGALFGQEKEKKKKKEDPTLRLKLANVVSGFRAYPEYGTRGAGKYKAGMWTPLYLTFEKQKYGYIRLPVSKGPEGFTDNRIITTFTDGTQVQAQYQVDFERRKKELHPALTYYCPGRTAPEPRFEITPGDRGLPGNRTFGPFANRDIASSIGMTHHLYLTLGSKLPELYQGMVDLAGNQPGLGGVPTGIRHLAYETEVRNLPDYWFGYEGVDLIILTTSNKQFITDLANLKKNEAKVAALGDWVRRGGRLVVSINWNYQDEVYRILNSPVWQPSFPPVLSRTKTSKTSSFRAVSNNLPRMNQVIPFVMRRGQEAEIPVLTPDHGEEVLAANRRADGLEHLMVRVPYGLGSVTLLAFAVDGPPFTDWDNGRGPVAFWNKFISQYGPVGQTANAAQMNPGLVGMEETDNDLTTQLHRELDKFNVAMISFSWVALFILIYILIVGPAEYFILKKVFKRLEWTWVTFPAVVLIISIAAYYTAYAIKGSELKINKVDLVDIDLRTELDKDGKTTGSFAYGKTWFTLLSPSIQNYTIGVDPRIWGFTNNQGQEDTLELRMRRAGKVTMSWMGRPQASRGFGQPGGQSLFSRTYQFTEGATEMQRVPIPVWTTKAFQADWAVRLKQMPFTSDLTFNPKDTGELPKGTITNNLPVPLKDVHLIYGKNFYPLTETLAASDQKDNKITLKGGRGERGMNVLSTWQGPWKETPVLVEGKPARTMQPGKAVAFMFFYDGLDPSSVGPNHSQRRVDQAWRFRDVRATSTPVRTAVLVGRLDRIMGSAEDVNKNDSKVPTRVWLNALPTVDDQQPQLQGMMVQQTYVRVILPVRLTTE
ncbi:MAG: hypothetical protein ACFCD0_18140 [Gemmataceae bacterium]